MNGKQNGHNYEPTRLCLDCALCCNGVLFADVRLRAGDTAAAQALARPSSRALIVGCTAQSPSQPPALRSRAQAKAPQPCAALKGFRCGIYQDRPTYCREFKCALLLSVEAGSVSWHEAAKTISATRLTAEKVKRLLRMLGDTKEDLPLASRFRRTTKRLEKLGLDEETGQIYGRLTLAFHDLNFQLSSSFYPD